MSPIFRFTRKPWRVLAMIVAAGLAAASQAQGSVGAGFGGGFGSGSSFQGAVDARITSQPQFMVITSDPQYPWTPYMDTGHGRECGNVEHCSRDKIESQYRSINRFAQGRSVVGTFINGDLTAFGHWWQIDYMRDAISRIRTPVYLGLGNHDYQNNINDCSENRCVRDSIQWFRQHMSHMRLDAFDMKVDNYYRFPSKFEDVHGSFGWTKRFGDVTVIQVNNEPEYFTEAHGWNFARAQRERIFVRTGMRWLEDQLRVARARGDAIVLMSHFGTGSEAVADLIDRYEVSVVFAGHQHRWLGHARDLGSAPVYFSGSASQLSYLIAEYTRGGKEMTVWRVRLNNEAKREVAGKVVLKRGARVVRPVLPHHVTVIDKGPKDANITTRVSIRNVHGFPLIQEFMYDKPRSWRMPDGPTTVNVVLERREGGWDAPWKKIGEYRTTSPNHGYLCIVADHAKTPTGHYHHFTWKC